MNKHQQEAYDILEYWEHHHRTRGHIKQADDYLRQMIELKGGKEKLSPKRRKPGQTHQEFIEQMPIFTTAEEQKRWRRRQRRLERKQKNQPAPVELTLPEKFSLEYTREVLDILSAEYPQLKTTTIQLWNAQRDKTFYRRNMIRLGRGSINYRWNLGHAEYAQVQHVIQGLHNIQRTALQLASLHEIAHLVVHLLGYHDHHGPRFQQVFADLILRFYDDTIQLEA